MRNAHFEMSLSPYSVTKLFCFVFICEAKQASLKLLCAKF